MNVQSILDSKGARVVTTRPDATIADVGRQFRIEGIGALVISEDGEMAGIVSIGDVVKNRLM
jgi:CBS domain-containing protein